MTKSTIAAGYRLAQQDFGVRAEPEVEGEVARQGRNQMFVGMHPERN